MVLGVVGAVIVALIVYVHRNPFQLVLDPVAPFEFITLRLGFGTLLPGRRFCLLLLHCDCEGTLPAARS